MAVNNQVLEFWVKVNWPDESWNDTLSKSIVSDSVSLNDKVVSVPLEPLAWFVFSNDELLNIISGALLVVTLTAILPLPTFPYCLQMLYLS